MSDDCYFFRDGRLYRSDKFDVTGALGEMVNSSDGKAIKVLPNGNVVKMSMEAISKMNLGLSFESDIEPLQTKDGKNLFVENGALLKADPNIYSQQFLRGRLAKNAGSDDLAGAL